MKKIIYIIGLILIMGLTANAKTAAPPPAGFGIFFTALSPHGIWMELDDGLVVWRPNIARRGWAPYREGRWLWTRDGWYWDSYEPFGYVTYHYGRWYYDDYYGWIWVPDYEWAPAWVEWRYDDVYIGWAPLPPYAVFSIGIGIHFTYEYHTPYAHWHFVSYRYFDDPYVYRHYVGHSHKHKIYSRTRYRTNYSYYDGRVVNRGVDIDYVRKRSGRDIKTREIERVRDFGEASRGDRNDRIRTLYIPKEELQKERDFNNDAIRRSERRSSLDLSRVEIGERRTVRKDDRKGEDVKVEERKRTVESRDTRNDRNDRSRTRIEVQKKQDDNNKERQTDRNDARIEREKQRKVESDRNRNEVRNQDKSREKREVKRPVKRDERKAGTRTDRSTSGNDRDKKRNRQR